jgi:hypothetical protein
MCGIQPPSISTKLVLHVWNHNNYVPGIPDFFNVFSTKAYFKNLIMPPKVGWLCRYGNPFRGGTNPVIMYEAAIGSDKLATDIDDHREVFRPCIPCYSECSRYNCDSNCDPNQQLSVTLTLNDLDLQPYAVGENSTGHQYNKTIVYFLTGMYWLSLLDFWYWFLVKKPLQKKNPHNLIICIFFPGYKYSKLLPKSETIINNNLVPILMFNNSSSFLIVLFILQ